MANIIYNNKVLENKVETLLSTAIDMNSYMTQDSSLTQSAGMTKTVNTYKATGSVEELAQGEGNTASFEVSFTPSEYTVKTTQGKFVYFDEEEMKDPKVVEVGLKGMSEAMVNDLTSKAIAEYSKATLSAKYATVINFDVVVDAIAAMNIEDEAGLFLMINVADKAAFRKNLAEDLKYSEGYVRTGYIGSVVGVPVIVSKAVPTGQAFLASKDAVTVFTKKGSEVEVERDADHRKNTVFARKVMLVALTDARKIVKITKTV